MVKICGLNSKGEQTDIYYGMSDESLPELVKFLLNEDDIELVSIEREKEDE
jgi:hypothetical protein